MSSLIFLAVVSGLACTASFFLATYYLLKNQNSISNKLLGFLFLAITLRLGKSIVFFAFHSLAPAGLAIGYIGLSSIGPLFYMYIQIITTENRTLIKTDLLHILLVPFGAVLSLFGSLDVVTLLYKATTGLLLIYIVLSYAAHKKYQYDNRSVEYWNVALIAGIFIVWIAFVYQHATEGIMDYAYGAGLASFAVYSIFIFGIKSPVVFNRTVSVHLPIESIGKIKKAMEHDKIYLKPDISLGSFSAQLDIPAYIVTKSVKKLYHRSFPETISYFRIEELKKKLEDPIQSKEKMETLAFEVGFNSPSVFFTVFKKQTGMSPKNYKMRALSHEKKDSIHP